MNSWIDPDDGKPFTIGQPSEGKHEAPSQPSRSGSSSHTLKRPRISIPGPTPSRPNHVKRQYHSLVLKFIIELAIDKVTFVYDHDLQRKKGVEVLTGSSMKVSQGWWRGEEVAIKTLKDNLIPQWADESNTNKKTMYRRTIKNLIYELRAMSHQSLRGHRNLATLLAIGFEPMYINNNKSDGTENINLEAFSPVLVLPWAFADLRSLWHKRGLEHPDDGAGIVSDIADALTALHKHDIVHCDLKPGNVLIFLDPLDKSKLVAKISDFGAISSKQNNRFVTGGTEGWAAPEFYEDYPDSPTEANFNDVRALDVYSFGLVAMYVALEGQVDEDWLRDTWDVDACRDGLDRTLILHYKKEWPEHANMMSKWRQLLQDTVVEKPKDRMHPDLLETIRSRLMDSDPFQEEKQLYYNTIVPFTGPRGWSDDHRHWLRFCSRMGKKRTSKAIKVLPKGIKDQLCKDYDDFNAWGVNFSRDLRYKRAASRLSFIAQAVVDDSSCLPIKIDHKGILLMTCNTPGSKGFGFFETWIALSLNCFLFFAPDLRDWIFKKITLLIGGSWESDMDEDRRRVWDAAQTGDIHTVKNMVTENRKLLRTSHLGRMLIHQAATFDQVEVVEFLLSQNSLLLNAKTALELTPLHVAVGGQAFQCIDFLLKQNASLDAKSVHGNTPLDHGLGCYVWSLIAPSWSPDKYQNVIQVLRRQKNLPKGALLSQNSLLKARADQFITSLSDLAYHSLVSYCLSALFWSTFGRYLPIWPSRLIWICQSYISFRFGKGHVEAVFALIHGSMYAALFATSLSSLDLWFSFLLYAVVWLGNRRAFYASRAQGEEEIIWHASGHDSAFNAANPKHVEEVGKIIKSGLFEGEKSLFGKNANRQGTLESSLSPRTPKPFSLDVKDVLRQFGMEGSSLAVRDGEDKTAWLSRLEVELSKSLADLEKTVAQRETFT